MWAFRLLSSFADKDTPQPIDIPLPVDQVCRLGCTVSFAIRAWLRENEDAPICLLCLIVCAICFFALGRYSVTVRVREAKIRKTPSGYL